MSDERKTVQDIAVQYPPLGWRDRERSRVRIFRFLNIIVWVYAAVLTVLILIR